MVPATKSSRDLREIIKWIIKRPQAPCAASKQGAKWRYQKVFLVLGVAQACTKELLLPWDRTDGVKDSCWAHSVQMSCSSIGFVLKGLGAQKKGQRQRLWSLALRESLWKPASTPAIVLICFLLSQEFRRWKGKRAHPEQLALLFEWPTRTHGLGDINSWRYHHISGFFYWLRVWMPKNRPLNLDVPCSQTAETAVVTLRDSNPQNSPFFKFTDEVTAL